MENIELGLYTTGLGMFIVFLGLVFLMYVMIALAGISKANTKKPSAPRKDEGMREKVEAVSEETVQTINAEPSVTAQDLKADAADSTGEIAAIAAVMAIMMSEGSSGVVTSVRQVGAKINAWAIAGRRDIMASRL